MFCHNQSLQSEQVANSVELQVVIAGSCAPLLTEQLRSLGVSRILETGREQCLTGSSVPPHAYFFDLDYQCEQALAVAAKVSAPVVFLASQASLAARAFDLRALDFLGKPMEISRLQESVRRIRAATPARARVMATQSETQIQQEKPAQEEKLALPVGRGTEFVAIQDIDYVRAQANYVSVHALNREFVLRKTMDAMQASLDPDRFLRVHRSFLVRIHAVTKVQQLNTERCLLQMRSGARVCCSRKARQELRQRLGL